MIFLTIWFLGAAFTFGRLTKYVDDWRDWITMPCLLLISWPFFLLMEWRNR